MRKKQPEFRAYKSATANGNHKWYIIGRPAGKRIRAWFATFRVRVDIQILRERNRSLTLQPRRSLVGSPAPTLRLSGAKQPYSGPRGKSCSKVPRLFANSCATHVSAKLTKLCSVAKERVRSKRQKESRPMPNGMVGFQGLCSRMFFVR